MTDGIDTHGNVIFIRESLFLCRKRSQKPKKIPALRAGERLRRSRGEAVGAGVCARGLLSQGIEIQ